MSPLHPSRPCRPPSPQSTGHVGRPSGWLPLCLLTPFTYSWVVGVRGRDTTPTKDSGPPFLGRLLLWGVRTREGTGRGWVAQGHYLYYIGFLFDSLVARDDRTSRPNRSDRSLFRGGSGRGPLTLVTTPTRSRYCGRSDGDVNTRLHKILNVSVELFTPVPTKGILYSF